MVSQSPRKTISIYDIPALVKTSLPLAATIDNIQSGFRVTGISPLNEDIFPESEFSGSYVTDRPIPLPNENDNVETTNSQLELPILPSESPSILDANFTQSEDYPEIKTPEPIQPLDSGNNVNRILQLSDFINMPSCSFVSPEVIRPFPKAGPRQENRKNVRKRKTTIYTDTPEKENLMELKSQQKRKESYKKKKNEKHPIKNKDKIKGKGKVVKLPKEGRRL